MTLATIPLEDNYNTTLAQERDGAVGTVYVNTAPTFTFPATRKSYITVDPWTDKMQVARISAYNATTKTLTVDSTAVYKGAWVLYTEQSHSIGAKVIISDNYQFWQDIANNLDLKVDTNDDDVAMGKFADATARDAYFTSPVNGNSAYLTSEGKRTDYVAGAWVDRATGSTPNASTTVAGKVEVATDAENTSWATTGWTGAILATSPAGMAKVIQSGSYLYAGASATGNDTYVVFMTPALTAYTTGMKVSFLTDVANTWACTLNIDWLWAKSIKTQGWSDPSDGYLPSWKIITLQYDWTNFVLDRLFIASNADAHTWTDTSSAVNPLQLKKYFWPAPIAGTDITVATSTTEVTTTSLSYTKKYEWTIFRTGTFTVYFELKSAWGTSCTGRIYKNWVAVWTEQFNNTASYVWFSEDFSFTEWDLVQLYIKNWSWSTSYAKNIKVTHNISQFTFTTY